MDVSFTDRELDLMQVLWDEGPSTVAEVREALDDDLAYNSVLTMLRVLEEKGYVRHEEEGRAYRYHPLVERRDAATSARRRLTCELFGGSPARLFLDLVENRELSNEELRRIRDLLDERLKDA